MSSSSRKIAYILGAGFSYGTGHFAKVGQTPIYMPLQNTLFRELCIFHHRKIDRLSYVAKYIRKYFSPNTYRTGRHRGSRAHEDLFGLSIEEIVTFFDELIRTNHPDRETIEDVIGDLQDMTVELISYLSTAGRPGQNKLLKRFVQRLAQTDVLITFNWDTLLDRALVNRRKDRRRKRGSFWNPSWGYGKTVRDTFTYSGEWQSSKAISRKYSKLLKLHGSINWRASKLTSGTESIIESHWAAASNLREVVMMPPKMIKPEIWDAGSIEPTSDSVYGNRALSGFYPKIWREAEDQLKLCRRIVFIGYSFPPADFAVGNMLRRSLSEIKATRQSPAIDIVDPNATQLAERFEKSFKIKVPMGNCYLSLKSYLDTNRAHIDDVV